MNRIVKGALILCASAGFLLAETWTGKLVDGNCQAESNSSKLPASCEVTPQTKVFAIQTPDGKIYRLDSEGNSKAASAVKNNPSKTDVTISGSMNGQMVKVQSLELQ
jgi:hypothetical protein